MLYVWCSSTSDCSITVEVVIVEMSMFPFLMAMTLVTHPYCKDTATGILFVTISKTGDL